MAATKYANAFASQSVLVVDLPPAPGALVAQPDIVLCVDTSGSMGGTPIDAVRQTLQHLHSQNTLIREVWCYSSTLRKMSLADAVSREIFDAGCTMFCEVFKEMQAFVPRANKDVVFIFMTDGCSSSSNQDPVEMQKIRSMLTMKGPGNKPLISKQVVVHTLGFGDNVNPQFLDQVRKLGNTEGVFERATVSNELIVSFLALVGLASSSKSMTITKGMILTDGDGNRTAHKPTQYAQYSASSVRAVFVTSAEIAPQVTVEYDGQSLTLDVCESHELGPELTVQAAHVFAPNDEGEVRAATAAINMLTVVDTVKLDAGTRKILDAVIQRLKEYHELYAQCKMAAVPAQIRLMLDGLRAMSQMPASHAVTTQELKLQARCAKNVDHFMTANIPQKLQDAADKITPEQWDAIKKLSESSWIAPDAITRDTLHQIMRKSNDGILCLGMNVRRNSGSGLLPMPLIISFGKTFITMKSYIDALASGTKLVGMDGQPVEAILPLFLCDEHWARVRLQQGILFGHLFTGLSTGYHKSQEAGFLRLVLDIIDRAVREHAERSALVDCVGEFHRALIEDLKKICNYFVTSSEAFASDFGSRTYAEFVGSLGFRGTNNTVNLDVIMMVAWLRNELSIVAPLVYAQLCKRCHAAKLTSDSARVRELVCGNKDAVLAEFTSSAVHANPDEDYVEQSFASYFYDGTKTPVALVPTTTAVRRAIAPSIPGSVLQEYMVQMPNELTALMRYAGCSYDTTAPNLDLLRAELLAALARPGQAVTEQNVLRVADEHVLCQGPYQEPKFGFTPENAAIVVRKILHTKSLPAFAGLLLLYCPQRCGVIFDATIHGLLRDSAVQARDKLIALLENKVGETTLYTHFANTVWLPLVSLDSIRNVVGPDTLEAIGQAHVQAGHLMNRTYRINTIGPLSARSTVNRPLLACTDPLLADVYKSLCVDIPRTNCRGHSNHNPYLGQSYPFPGYRDLSVAQERSFDLVYLS